jgi:hypothetical protein
MVLGNAFYKTKGQMAKVKAAGKKLNEEQIRNQMIKENGIQLHNFGDIAVIASE